jgi:hypothetical protein
MNAFIQALTQNDLIDVGAVAAVPKRPGLYGWFFKEAPPGVPLQNCLFRNEMPLLYIGIAPKEPRMNGTIQKESTQSLRHRIQYHYWSNAEGSTLRLTLGCLLAFQLGLELRRVGGGRRMTFGLGEARLSEWMASHAYVTWFEHLAPWEPEARLFSNLSLPLNLAGNGAHPYSRELRDIRGAARNRARALPILS